MVTTAHATVAAVEFLTLCDDCNGIGILRVSIPSQAKWANHIEYIQHNICYNIIDDGIVYFFNAKKANNPIDIEYGVCQ